MSYHYTLLHMIALWRSTHQTDLFLLAVDVLSIQLIAHGALIRKNTITNVFCFFLLQCSFCLSNIESFRIAGGHHPLFKIALSSIFFQPCPRTVSNYLAHLYADFNRKKIYEYATCQFCNDFLSNANLLKSGFRSHHIVEFYFLGKKTKHDNFL